MRSMILLMCAGLFSFTATAQETERVPSSPKINLAKTGNRQSLPGNLKRYGIDTTIASKIKVEGHNVPGGNPSAIRMHSVKANCDNNSILLSWTAIQQKTSNADMFEIEQSSDEGRHWINIGIVPAFREDIGEVNYTFRYNKSLGNVQLRIVSVNTAGERVSSPGIQAPCSNTATLKVTPNPVVSAATLRIGSPDDASVKITLVNSSGMVVQARDAGLQKGNNNIPLDMSNLKTGYYIVNILWTGSGKQDVVKVVKE